MYRRCKGGRPRPGPTDLMLQMKVLRKAGNVDGEYEDKGNGEDHGEGVDEGDGEDHRRVLRRTRRQ